MGSRLMVRESEDRKFSSKYLILSDLDTVDNEGDTALHCAVRNNHVDIIESLLDAGATSSITNLRHMAPLHIACDLGNLDALEVSKIVIVIYLMVFESRLKL